MAREFAKWFYTSSKWVKCRNAFVAYRESIDGGLCEDCRENPGKIVHHKTFINENNINDPDITLNFDNLKYVCQNCHNIEEHGYGRKRIQGEIEYAFDADGNPVITEKKKRW